MVEKLENQGKNALKILDVQDHYLLGEMKVMRPPYRLYVIVDQKNDKFYIVEWQHKERQEKIINELRGKLLQAISLGLERIFTQIQSIFLNFRNLLQYNFINMSLDSIDSLIDTFDSCEYMTQEDENFVIYN